MKHLILLAFAGSALVMAASSCGGDDADGTPAGGGGPGGQGGGGGSTGDGGPMLVHLSHEADLAQAYAVAPLGEGRVAVLIASTSAPLGWAPAHGSVNVAGERIELQAIAADGTIEWSKPISQSAMVASNLPSMAATPNGEVVVIHDDQLQVFDGAGQNTASASFLGGVYGVASSPSGVTMAYLVLDETQAPSYGLPPVAVGVLVRDALQDDPEVLVVDEDPLFTKTPMAVDELGVAWIGSLHRVAVDGTITRLGIPDVTRVQARAGGGARAQFVQPFEGYAEDPSLTDLASGGYWVEVAADGAVLPAPMSVGPDAAVATSSLGTLYGDWETIDDGVVWLERDRLVLGQPPGRVAAAGTSHVAPHDVLATDEAFWVVGTFSGHLELFGKQIAAGTAYGQPYLLRIPTIDALSEMGGDLPVCSAASEACTSCIGRCTSASPCAFVEDCSFAITELSKCLCRAPEQAQVCTTTWNASGDAKVDLVEQCHTGTCASACGL